MMQRMQLQQEHRPILKRQDMNYLKMRLIMLCIGPFYFGYCFCQFSSMPRRVLVAAYGFQILQTGVWGLFLSLIPLGAALAVPFASLMLKKMNKRRMLLITTLFGIFIEGLIQYRNIYMFGACRFFQGFTSCLFLSLVPAYINELCPRRLQPNVSMYATFGVIVGVVFCYAFALALIQFNFTNLPFWRIMISLNLILLLVFVLLILTRYIPESPECLIREGDHQGAKQIMKKLQGESYYPENFQQKKKEVETVIKITEATSGKAKFMAFMLAALPSLVGGNVYAVLAGDMVGTVDPPLGQWTPFILNFSQMLGTLYNVFFFPQINRRTLLVIGSGWCAAANLMMALFFYNIQWQVSQLIMFIIFMSFAFMAGLTFASAAGAYVGMLASDSTLQLVNVWSWLVAAATIAWVPYAIQIKNNPFVVTLVYGCFSLVFFVMCLLLVKEIRGLTKEEVRKKFMG